MWPLINYATGRMPFMLSSAKGQQTWRETCTWWILMRPLLSNKDDSLLNLWQVQAFWIGLSAHLFDSETWWNVIGFVSSVVQSPQTNRARNVGGFFLSGVDGLIAMVVTKAKRSSCFQVETMSVSECFACQLHEILYTHSGCWKFHSEVVQQRNVAAFPSFVSLVGALLESDSHL